MGHLGIHKCRETAQRNVWWPCMSSQLADMIRACRKCQRNRPERSEPLMPLEFPERPWEHIETDLFHWHNSEYLIAVDYHSRFFEVAKLQRTDSESIIEQLKSFFADHGIPQVVISDTLHVDVNRIELCSKAAIISMHVIVLRMLGVLCWPLGMLCTHGQNVNIHSIKTANKLRMNLL